MDANNDSRHSGDAADDQVLTLLMQEIRGHREATVAGVAALNARLDQLNGQTRRHGESIAVLDQRTGRNETDIANHIERDRQRASGGAAFDKRLLAILSALAAGVGAAYAAVSRLLELAMR